jgi:hypothetical protein
VDIDIDFANRDLILSQIQYTTAILENKSKHNTGVYVTDIPRDSLTNLATIDYKVAEERGYFKLDFLNVNIYKDVKNEEHLIKLMNEEPLWYLLEEKDFVDKLFHLNGHSAICQKLKPSNIPELAAVLAIIRPSKRYLLNKDWNEIKKYIWEKPTDGSYYFKKAHAHSYAVAVAVQMNLLTEPYRS